jgi:hypothetical protein
MRLTHVARKPSIWATKVRITFVAPLFSGGISKKNKDVTTSGKHLVPT